MKMNSDFMWSMYLIGTATLFFYFGSLIGKARTNEDLDQEIQNKEEKIQVLERENLQLSEQLTSRGIFSYPRAGIIEPENNIALLIMLHGQKPLKDLEVRREIILNYSQIPGKDEEFSAKKGKPTYLGSLKPHTPASLEVSIEEKEAAIALNFKSHRNQWNQYIRIQKTPSGKAVTFWIITNENNVVIDKHIDEDFPLEEDGSILLWKDKKVEYSEIEMNSTFRTSDINS